MSDEFALEFTTQELKFLGSLFRSGDEARDWGDENTSSGPAQASLAVKNYIRPATNVEELVLDTSVAALISVMGDPQSAVLVSSFHGRAVEPEQLRLCAARGLIVDQRDDDNNHTLTAIRTRDVALQRLLAFVGLKEQPAAHTESFRLAADEMAKLPYVIAGGGAQDGESFLREAGAPAQAAARLAAALDSPVRQSNVRAAVWRGGEPREVGRLTLLEEVYGLWLIAPVEGDQVAIIPVSADAAAGHIRELAFRVLPVGADSAV